MNLFELFVKIGVDDQASEKVSSISNKLGNGLKTAAKVGATAITAVTAATTAMTASFVKSTGELASYGDNIDKMSQKMGLSAQAYQEWDFIMQHSGTSMESLKAGMKTLANAVDSGNAAFGRLGISQEEIANLNQEELFAKTIEQLQKVENETERTYLAGQLLGRGATELGALLNTSAEDTEAMRKQVHELGGVMSDEAVKSAAAYQDSLQNMQTALDGTKRQLISSFLPSIVSVMDGLALVFSGDDSGIEKMTEGVNDFTKNLISTVPKIIKVGGDILNSLIDGILENLPTMASSATKAMTSFITGIVEKLPDVVEGAIEVIKALSEGIIEALPVLTPTIITVVLQMVDILTRPDTLVPLVNAALLVMVAIAGGIIQALPQIIATAPTIISNLARGIVNSAPMLKDAGWSMIKTLGNSLGIDKAYTWGKDLMDNFISGIMEKWEKLKGTVSEVAQTVKDYIGFSEPKKGPLSNFHTYAPDMMELFAKGIRDNENLVTNQIEKSFDFGVKTLDFSTSGIQANGGIGFGGVPNASTVNVVQNIYSEVKTAADLMAEAIYQQEKAVMLGV